jgi:hypothetical protein
MRQHGVIRLLHGVAALIAAHREDSTSLRARLGAGGDRPKETPDFLLMAQAVAAEQRDRPDDALALLKPVSDQQHAHRVVRLALAVGDSAAAEAAVAACEAEAARESLPARWCRALLDGDTQVVLDVAEHFARVGRKIEYGMAAEDSAVLLARDGRGAEALRAFRDAKAVYTELGATWDIRRAERRMRQNHASGSAVGPQAGSGG